MCSSPVSFRPAAVIALLALALGLTVARPGVAAGATGAPGASRSTPLPSSTGATIGACSAACLAQQSLASALHDPIRIGNTHLSLAVASSKLTVGWAIAF